MPVLRNAQNYRILNDKGFVSRFVENAVRILEAAESAVESGHTPSDVTILIGPEGSLRMVADSDWPLDSLQSFHGSNMAYRVSQRASMVRVEGRAGSRTCLFPPKVKGIRKKKPNPRPFSLTTAKEVLLNWPFPFKMEPQSLGMIG